MSFIGEFVLYARRDSVISLTYTEGSDIKPIVINISDERDFIKGVSDKLSLWRLNLIFSSLRSAS